MEIPSGQGGPTAAFFQALQGTPRADNEQTAQESAKPVTRDNGPRAVEAASRSERNTPPPKDDGRDFPRGSFVDIKA